MLSCRFAFCLGWDSVWVRDGIWDGIWDWDGDSGWDGGSTGGGGFRQEADLSIGVIVCIACVDVEINVACVCIRDNDADRRCVGVPSGNGLRLEGAVVIARLCWVPVLALGLTFGSAIGLVAVGTPFEVDPRRASCTSSSSLTLGLGPDTDTGASLDTRSNDRRPPTFRSSTSPSVCP